MKRRRKTRGRRVRSEVTPQPQPEPKPQPTPELPIPGEGTLGILEDVSKRLAKDKDDIVVQVLRLEDIVGLLKRRSEESRISQVDPDYLVYHMR